MEGELQDMAASSTIHINPAATDSVHQAWLQSDMHSSPWTTSPRLRQGTANATIEKIGNATGLAIDRGHPDDTRAEDTTVTNRPAIADQNQDRLGGKRAAAQSQVGPICAAMMERLATSDSNPDRNTWPRGRPRSWPCCGNRSQKKQRN